jgi:prophage regulatory protein
MERNEATSSRKRAQPRQTVLTAQIPEALLKIQTVVELTGLSQSSIRRRVLEQEFPAPVKNGTRCTRWVAGSVMAYLRRQAAEA